MKLENKFPQIGKMFLGRMIVDIREDSIMLRSHTKYPNGNSFKCFWIKFKLK